MLSPSTALRTGLSKHGAGFFSSLLAPNGCTVRVRSATTWGHSPYRAEDTVVCATFSAFTRYASSSRERRSPGGRRTFPASASK
jgi:hypothetical protein